MCSAVKTLFATAEGPKVWRGEPSGAPPVPLDWERAVEYCQPKGRLRQGCLGGGEWVVRVSTRGPKPLADGGSGLARLCSKTFVLGTFCLATFFAA